ncbi:hypothetical protein EV424DRAFT_248927 [Suillus variegatus]|nr:hypothetical protein EV424DRAFT_248927 [Suillus variegatus]
MQQTTGDVPADNSTMASTASASDDEQTPSDPVPHPSGDLTHQRLKFLNLIAARSLGFCPCFSLALVPMVILTSISFAYCNLFLLFTLHLQSCCHLYSLVLFLTGAIPTI